jgi:hypothetical protein
MHAVAGAGAGAALDDPAAKRGQAPFRLRRLGWVGLWRDLGLHVAILDRSS